MESKRIDAIRRIVTQIEGLSVAVDGHLKDIREEAESDDGDDAAQRLEFAFAELRAARRELIEATRSALTPA